MKRRLFLTGPQGAGKSRLIREALGERLLGLGGFMSCPVADAAGYLRAVVLRPAAAVAGAEGLPEPAFLDWSSFPPTRDNEVFRVQGTRLLREAALYDAALLDELGGYELLIPQFRAALDELLQSGLPLVGALKTAEEAEQWRALFGLGGRFPREAAQLRAALTADPDTQILDLAAAPEEEILAALRAWADAYAAG